MIYSCSLTESVKETNKWPQFRGVNCSGIAYENAKPPIEFNEKNMLWKTELPTGHSSPCIWGNNIFITGCLPDEKKLEMICINRDNGKIKWQHSLSVDKFEKLTGGVSNAAQSTPVTDGERVYFYFGSYGLQCYKVTGELLWEKRLPVGDSRYGSASSPVIHNEMLLLCRDFMGEGKLYAINKISGDSVWTAKLPEKPEPFTFPSFSTPVIWGDLIILHRMWQSAAYRVADGVLEWWITIPTNGNSTPVLGKDVLYYAAWGELSEKERRWELPDFNTMKSRHDGDKDGFIKVEEIPEDLLLFDRPGNDIQAPWYLRNFFGLIDKNNNGLCDNSEWEAFVEFIKSYSQDGGLFAVRPDRKGELPATTLIWKVSDKVPEVPSPLYYNNLVYMCKDGGLLTCVNSDNGEILYRELIGAKGSFIASPVEANGYIYLTSAKGVITVIKAGRKLDIVKQSNLGETVFATPAIVGNSFYVRTTGYLYAFK